MMSLIRLSNTIKKYILHTGPQEIHVETVVSDLCYIRLLGYLHKHRKVMCMLVGPWEPEIKARLRADLVDQIMAKRYAVIAKLAPIGLHVHVLHPYAIETPTYKKQLIQISDAKQFLEKIGLNPIDFSPGWWNYNRDTVKACETLGIKRFHYSERKGFENSDRLRFIRIVHAIHDYDLAK